MAFSRSLYPFRIFVFISSPVLNVLIWRYHSLEKIKYPSIVGVFFYFNPISERNSSYIHIFFPMYSRVNILRPFLRSDSFISSGASVSSLERNIPFSRIYLAQIPKSPFCPICIDSNIGGATIKSISNRLSNENSDTQTKIEFGFVGGGRTSHGWAL